MSLPTRLPRGPRAQQGVVVSDKMDKTVVVRVEKLKKHPVYGRTVRRSRRLKAHDEANVARVGDRVVIVESRPVSKQKHWRVARVLQHSEAVDAVLSSEQPESLS